MGRADVACMMRIRNEERWIRESLERTFTIAQTIVILDDGSEDGTLTECVAAVGPDVRTKIEPGVELYQADTPAGMCELRLIRSPFRPVIRESHAGNQAAQLRDRNFLWEYCKARVPFWHMVCLDGDEVLSRDFLRRFDNLVAHLEAGIDCFTIPFIYLWDSNDLRRNDGIYGDLKDKMPQLRFPRVFTIRRMAMLDLIRMRFAWEGKGGFGSVPQENFNPLGRRFGGGTSSGPIIHYGYRDAADRQRKYELYTKNDPGNKFEGEYKHIIGQPNQHAPGVVSTIPWKDV